MNILADIRKKLDDGKAVLAEMGTPCNTLGDKRVYFQSLVSDLVARVTQYTSGGDHSSDLTMTAKMHNACARYKEAIDAGRLVHMSEIQEGSDVLATTKRGVVRGKVIKRSGSEAFIDYADRRTVRCTEFMTDATESVVSCVDENTGSTFNLRGFPVARLTRDSSWLREMIIRRRTDGLPTFLNSKIFESIQAEFICDDWDPACLELAATVSTIIGEMISLTITKNVSIDARYPRLHGRLCGIQDGIELESHKKATKRVKSFVARNLFPYSQNDILFETFSELRTEGLRQQLLTSLDVGDEVSESKMAKSTIRKVVDAIFDGYQRRSVEECMTDDMSHALEAYGTGAQTRFIDEVPVICWEIFCETPSKFQEALWALSDDDLDHILQESPAHVRICRDKSEEVEQLSKAIGIFSDLM